MTYTDAVFAIYAMSGQNAGDETAPQIDAELIEEGEIDGTDFVETAETLADFLNSGWKVESEENGVFKLGRVTHRARIGRSNTFADVTDTLFIADCGDKRLCVRGW